MQVPETEFSLDENTLGKLADTDWLDSCWLVISHLLTKVTINPQPHQESNWSRETKQSMLYSAQLSYIYIFGTPAD